LDNLAPYSLTDPLTDVVPPSPPVGAGDFGSVSLTCGAGDGVTGRVRQDARCDLLAGVSTGTPSVRAAAVIATCIAGWFTSATARPVGQSMLALREGVCGISIHDAAADQLCGDTGEKEIRGVAGQQKHPIAPSKVV
jgi:hypothetical protein